MSLRTYYFDAYSKIWVTLPTYLIKIVGQSQNNLKPGLSLTEKELKRKAELNGYQNRMQ